MVTVIPPSPGPSMLGRTSTTASGGDGPEADRWVVFVGRQAWRGPGGGGAGHVSVDRVARLNVALDRLGGAAELSHAVDLSVDLVVAGDRAVDGDGDPAVAGDLDAGPDLDDGVEGDVAVFLAARDVDLRGRDDVDVVLDDRRGVVLGQGVLEGLRATHKGPEARFEDLAGRLARPEAGQADLLGDLLEGGGDGLVELVRGNLDGQLDLVPLEGFDGALHAEGEIGRAHV